MPDLRVVPISEILKQLEASRKEPSIGLNHLRDLMMALAIHVANHGNKITSLEDRIDEHTNGS